MDKSNPSNPPSPPLALACALPVSLSTTKSSSCSKAPVLSCTADTHTLEHTPGNQEFLPVTHKSLSRAELPVQNGG